MRLMKSFLAIRKLSNWFAVYKINEGYKKAWKNSHYYSEYPSDFSPY